MPWSTHSPTPNPIHNTHSISNISHHLCVAVTTNYPEVNKIVGHVSLCPLPLSNAQLAAQPPENNNNKNKIICCPEKSHLIYPEPFRYPLPFRLFITPYHTYLTLLYSFLISSNYFLRGVHVPHFLIPSFHHSSSFPSISLHSTRIPHTAHDFLLEIHLPSASTPSICFGSGLPFFIHIVLQIFSILPLYCVRQYSFALPYPLSSFLILILPLPPVILLFLLKHSQLATFPKIPCYPPHTH